MNTAFPILGSILLLVLFLFLFQLLTLRWVQRRSRSAIWDRYTDNQIVMKSLAANFFGQTSKGKAQIRGNGALVLSKNELWFRMALPQRELTIPLASITSVSIVKSHLGKTKLMPLLYVEFISPAGIDSVAWLVEYPEEWMKAIGQVRHL